MDELIGSDLVKRMKIPLIRGFAGGLKCSESQAPATNKMSERVETATNKFSDLQDFSNYGKEEGVRVYAWLAWQNVWVLIN